MNRAIEAKQRAHRREAQEKAYFDYTLADAIGRSVARLYSDSNEFPKIEELYSGLFDKQEIEQERQKRADDISMIRFKQFAKTFNKKLEMEVKE